jgi:hypothetical protein
VGDPLDRIYGKTELARTELESRSRHLLGTARTVLILVDGRSSVRALNARLGCDASAVLDGLLKSAHVALLEPPKPPPPRPVREARETPPPTEDLAPMCRAAIARLAPHFGPDVTLIAKPLLEATDRKSFNEGLTQIERKLAVYMGKAQAARTVADLRV